VGGAVGAAVVGAEDELVEMALQVLGADGAAVRTREPALDPPQEQVGRRQVSVGLAPRAREVDGLMRVGGGVEPLVMIVPPGLV